MQGRMKGSMEEERNGKVLTTIGTHAGLLSILSSVYITSMYIFTIIMISPSWLLPTHTNIHKNERKEIQEEKKKNP